MRTRARVIAGVLHELLESWDGGVGGRGRGLGGFGKASVLTKVEQQKHKALAAF